MSTFINDIKYGIRQLIKNPGFTIVAALTLAIGIGANTAIFSAVNATLIRPLPYFEANRIQFLWTTNPMFAAMGYPVFPPSYNDVTEWRNQSRSFESVVACRPGNRTLTDGDTPEKVGGAIVTHNFFALFGVTPILGRGFIEEEDTPGRNQVVVISYRLWQRRFASDPAIINREVILDGVNHTVVGVMPPEFQFPRGAELPSAYGFANQVDLWMPFGLSTANWTERSTRNIVALARLKRGVTLATAQTELSGIAARLEQQFPKDNTDMGVKLLPLRHQMIASSRTPLLMLFGAVGFVLLIACANIANLLLARATTRQKEIAIRSALGAGRARIIQQLLTESLLLAGLGALLAIGFAQLGITILLKFGPANIPQLRETRLDLISFLFTMVVAMLAALIFGLIPALQAAKIDLQQAYKTSSRSVTGGDRHLRGAFVVSQIALALTLLVGSGLLIRSLVAVLAVDAGFRPDSVLTFELGLSGEYNNLGKRAALFDQFRQRLESVPGVQATGTISLLPLGGSGDNLTPLEVEGAPLSKNEDEKMTEERRVAGSYFQAMGITLVKGRFFTDQEVSNAAHRVVVNETLVRRFFATQDPIGKRLKFGDLSRNDWWEIVGVVHDVKTGSLEAPSRLQIYRPTLDWGGSMAMVVRMSREPRSLVSQVRAQLKAIDSSVPITKIRTMEEVVDDTVTGRRFNMLLVGLFATLALVLTTIGLYGSVSYWVSQRTREIGIRMALGANRGDVILRVIRQGLKLVMLGVAIGLVGAFTLTRFLAYLLFGITPRDPITFVGVVSMLLAVALLACFIPARRAANIDPMEALRYE